MSRVRPAHDSWFVVDQRGLRTVVTGSELRRSKPPDQTKGTLKDAGEKVKDSFRN